MSPHLWMPISVTWSEWVDTTNNVLNYWTLRFGVENTGGGGSVEQDITTASQVAGTRYAAVGTTFANEPYDFSSGAAFDVFLEVRKDNGNPGQINIFGVNLIWRRVYQ